MDAPAAFKRLPQTRQAHSFDLFVFPVARSGTAEPTEPCVIRSRRSYGNLAVRLTARNLPAVVGERLVRFRHLVRVFALLDRVAATVRCIENLAGELGLHRLLTA